MYGLIGRPLGHSFSAKYFNDKFLRENIDEEYRLFPLEEINLLPSLLLEHKNLKGLNVTIPYKQEVIKYLDEISEDAAAIGAVNVIKIVGKDDKFRLKGFNSDVVGFKNSIQPLLRPGMDRALVLGTGGASKAVIHALNEMGLETLSVSRSKTEDAISYADVNSEIIKKFHVIVNTTPLGMWPNIDEAPKIPYDSITSDHLLFDLVYNPELTQFMKLGIKRGALVKNGLEMLYGQAIEAWRIWTDKE